MPTARWLFPALGLLAVASLATALATGSVAIPTGRLLAVLGGLARVRGRVSLGDLTLLDSERGIDLPVRRRRVGLVGR